MPIPGIPVDGPMRVTDNVAFADNYWRSAGAVTQEHVALREGQ